jgi:hypothetical protein
MHETCTCSLRGGRRPARKRASSDPTGQRLHFDSKCGRTAQACVRIVCQISPTIARGKLPTDLRPISQLSSNQPSAPIFTRARVREVCLSLRAKEETLWRKVGQIIARGDRRWLIRVYFGRDHETNKRNYHNRTIHGPLGKRRLT